jgi:hypothetical protein
VYCKVNDTLKGAYGKFGQSDYEDKMIMEYENFLLAISSGLPR